jgi:hypothetical protein
MYLPYFKRKVVFCSQKVEKLAKSMGFVVGSKASNYIDWFITHTQVQFTINHNGELIAKL